MPKKAKKPEEIENKIKGLIKELTKYDDLEYSIEREDALNEVRDKLVSIGKPAVPQLIDWKYRNVDFFHLLDCMMRQQDKGALSHIKKVRDFFSENYTDYKICQMANILSM